MDLVILPLPRLHEQPRKDAMNTTNDLHVVIGGTGAIGSTVVEELLRRGHRVRSVARRETTMDPRVEQRVADVMDRPQAIEAVAGASVVYQTSAPEYTRWVDEFP